MSLCTLDENISGTGCRLCEGELARLRRIEAAAHQALHLAGYDRGPVVMSPTDVAVLRGLALDHLAKATKTEGPDNG